MPAINASEDILIPSYEKCTTSTWTGSPNRCANEFWPRFLMAAYFSHFKEAQSKETVSEITLKYLSCLFHVKF